jgi:hypothetical protein
MRRSNHVTPHITYLCRLLHNKRVKPESDAYEIGATYRGVRCRHGNDASLQRAHTRHSEHSTPTHVHTHNTTPTTRTRTCCVMRKSARCVPLRMISIARQSASSSNSARTLAMRSMLRSANAVSTSPHHERTHISKQLGADVQARRELLASEMSQIVACDHDRVSEIASNNARVSHTSHSHAPSCGSTLSVGPRLCSCACK